MSVPQTCLFLASWIQSTCPTLLERRLSDGEGSDGSCRGAEAEVLADTAPSGDLKPCYFLEM